MSSEFGAGDEPRDQLPPSALFVLDVLEQEGEAKRQELLARTDLPETTFNRAAGRLQNGGYLSKTRANDDLRQVVFTLGPAHDYNMTDS